MSERQNHCPFLNRSDSRCSSYFSLDRLQHAFEHCFDQYQACPRYQELLKERMDRRAAALAGAQAAAHPGQGWGPAAPGDAEPTYAQPRLVQITVAHQHAQRVSAA